MDSRDRVDLLDVTALLTPDEAALRDRLAAHLADEVTPHIEQWYAGDHFPVELVGDFGDLGLLGMHLDGYGCPGRTAVEYGVACMELEAVDSGLRSFVSVQGSLAMYAIWRWGSEDQKQTWLPRLASGQAVGCFGLTEPHAGSNPAAIRTQARRDGTDWVLDGTKRWATNGTAADVAIVWARSDDGMRGFVVATDTPGFTARPIGGKLSLRASISAELELAQCRLPSTALLPEARGLSGPLACLDEARYGIVWGAVGATRTCLTTAVDHAVSREQFGKPLAGFQLTQQKLADMATAYTTSYLVALHLGRRKDGSDVTPEQISFGKRHNVRQALDTARIARTILGGNGITQDFPVMRHVQNLETVLTYEGTEEVHTLVVGEALTGISAYE